MKIAKAILLASTLAICAVLLAAGQSGTTQHDGMTVRGQIISTVASGTPPFVVTSTTKVANLNADLLDGQAGPASAILGLTDTQSPTNKTLNVQSNTFVENTPTSGRYFRDNGTSFQPSAIQAGDVPVFVASGASHAPGAVPDPGSTAGTSHFLREDGTWVIPPVGTSEAAWSWGSLIVNLTNNTPCPTGANYCSETVFAKSHTVVRLSYTVTTAAAACSTNAVVGVRDVTSSTNVSTLTVTQSTGTFVDSGAISNAMTAGDVFILGMITAPVGCGTFPTISNLTAVMQ